MKILNLALLLTLSFSAWSQVPDEDGVSQKKLKLASGEEIWYSGEMGACANEKSSKAVEDCLKQTAQKQPTEKKISGDLPEVCKSSKLKDKMACDNWMKLNNRVNFGTHEADAALARIQAQDSATCYNCGLSAEIPGFCSDSKSHNQIKCKVWIKHLVANLDESGSEKLPDTCKSENQKDLENCSRWLKTYHNKKKVSALEGCEMSVDEKEITCGEKVYTLSGKVSNMARINSKLDLHDSSNQGQPLLRKHKAKEQ
jgi:hypothetical protein